MKFNLRSKILAMSKFFLYMAWLQCLFATVAFAESSYAQRLEEVRVSNHWKRTSLEQAFAEIQQQTDYFFIYDSNQIDKVSLSGKNDSMRLLDLLKFISSETGLQFMVKENLILVEYDKGDLSNSPALKKDIDLPPLDQLEYLALKVIHQVDINAEFTDVVISGQITDTDGEPLIGASIILKNTGQGTVTNTNGSFSLAVAELNDQVLVVSYIGYITREVEVDGRTLINIILQESTAELNEVVVVGYGTQKKVNLTGAVSQAKSEDFIEERQVLSLGQALQGIAPGLTITKSNGIPGGSYSFNIRGATSLNGGEPLILVDGSEMDPNLIPPEDIESVSILKDAASAAIYGARAAFGVILITTKSGKLNSKPSFSFSTTMSSTVPTILPDKVDPITQIEIGGVAWENAGRTPGWYWGRNVDIWTGLYRASDYVANSGEYIDGVYYPLGDNNNMIDLMVEPSFTIKNNFSVSGGSEKTSYYLNAGLMNQNGILVYDKDKYSRRNVLAKVETSVEEWLSIGATLGYTHAVQKFPTIPNNPAYVYDVSYLRPTFWQTGIDEVSGAPWGFSPAIIGLAAENTATTDNTNIQLHSTLQPFKGLSINGTYSHRNITVNDSYHVNTYEQANSTSGAGVVFKYRNDPNSLRKTATFDTFDNLFVTTSYTNSWKEHNFKLLAGYSQEDSKWSSYWAERQSLISDDIPSLNLATGNQVADDAITRWTTRSVFSRLNYDFRGKYLLEGVLRYDGSSRFPKNDRFVYSPSFSAGWTISEEPFWQDGPGNWFEFFKLRFSLGTQGNQAVGAYAYIPSMSTGSANWILNGERPLYVSPGGLVSNSFTWEKVNTTNFGLDVGFFQNKLQATVEIYSRKTIGMLTAAEELPALLGTSAPRENSADLKVDGWELSLNWKERLSDNFTYNVGLILYDDRATITKFNGNPTNYLGNYYPGQQLGEIWGYETDRLFQENDFVAGESDRTYASGIPTQDRLFDNRVPFPGDVKYKDLNGDGVVDFGENTLEDHGDLKVIGNSRSRYQYGVTLGARFKGFDLSFFFQGVAKKDLWTSGPFAFTAGAQYASVFEHTLDYWTPERTDAYYPRPDDRIYNRRVQSRYLLNAAYLRLKNARLGYTLPSGIFKRVGVESVKLFLTGENLFVITGLPKGLDPELGASHTYPINKDYAFGLSLTF